MLKRNNRKVYIRKCFQENVAHLYPTARLTLKAIYGNRPDKEVYTSFEVKDGKNGTRKKEISNY